MFRPFNLFVVSTETATLSGFGDVPSVAAEALRFKLATLGVGSTMTRHKLGSNFVVETTSEVTPETRVAAEVFAFAALRAEYLRDGLAFSIESETDAGSRIAGLLDEVEPELLASFRAACLDRKRVLRLFARFDGEVVDKVFLASTDDEIRSSDEALYMLTGESDARGGEKPVEAKLFAFLPDGSAVETDLPTRDSLLRRRSGVGSFFALFEKRFGVLDEVPNPAFGSSLPFVGESPEELVEAFNRNRLPLASELVLSEDKKTASFTYDGGEPVVYEVFTFSRRVYAERFRDTLSVGELIRDEAPRGPRATRTPFVASKLFRK